MHDLLFEKAPELDRPALDELARELGLDMVRFKKAMDEETHLPELQENLKRIHDVDIWSTPTIIINGVALKGAQPYENYRKVINEALGLSSRRQALPQGLLQGLSQRLSWFMSAISGVLMPTDAHAEGKVFGQGKVPLYVRVPDLKPTNQPRIGDQAPDFTLPGVDDNWITLSDYRGNRNVLLSFLPAAFTPV